MRIKEIPLTVNQVRDLWDYDPITGVMTNKPRPQKQGVRKDLFGKEAGQKTRDGLVVWVGSKKNKQSYLAHRVVWLHYYGEHADGNIEHIDGNKHNNAIGNLRIEDASYKLRELTYEDFAVAFEYNPDTGVITRKIKASKYSDYDEGDATGTYEANGYLVVNYLGRSHRMHRLAWMLYYKKWPNFDIDHINGDRKDNRIVNLRDATAKINAQNIRKAPVNSSTGYLGVTKKGNKYRAQISLNGSKKHLGYFDTAEEAHERYVEMKRILHPGCTI